MNGSGAGAGAGGAGPGRAAARAGARPPRRRPRHRGPGLRLSLALVPALALAACEWQGPPVGWSFERMIDQRHFDAYEPADLFPDGKVMRHPPEGVVHHDAPRGPVAVMTGRVGTDTVVLERAGVAGPAGPEPDTVRQRMAGFVDRIPIPLDSAELTRGRDRFRVFCAVCHGIDGGGDSPVARNMALRKPPSLHSPRIRAMPDGKLFSVITEGYGFMPSYAAELSVRERWAVVGYVRALQLSRRLPLDSLPPALRAAFRRGLAEPSPPPDTLPSDTVAGTGAGERR